MSTDTVPQTDRDTDNHDTVFTFVSGQSSCAYLNARKGRKVCNAGPHTNTHTYTHTTVPTVNHAKGRRGGGVVN